MMLFLLVLTLCYITIKKSQIQIEKIFFIINSKKNIDEILILQFVIYIQDNF